MKEFRDLRARVGFLELCKSPDLCCQVTVHAQETINADAAIIFADILLILDSLNVGLAYLKGEGPRIERPVRSDDDFSKLPEIEVAEDLGYVIEAIKLTRAALKGNIPLIGFAAAPFTLASYLIEGGSSRNYENTKIMMYRRPDLWHKLMDKLVGISIAYLNAQIDAGAQALQVFDSWIGAVSEYDYKEYVLPHSKALFAGLVKQDLPLIHFGTGNQHLLPLMKDAGANVMGLDWRCNLKTSWDALGDLAVQGNLDPCVLLAERSYVKESCDKLMNSVAGRNGHIFNLGHGVLPGTDLDNVKYLVELVQNFNGRV